MEDSLDRLGRKKLQDGSRFRTGGGLRREKVYVVRRLQLRLRGRGQWGDAPLENRGDVPAPWLESQISSFSQPIIELNLK